MPHVDPVHASLHAVNWLAVLVAGLSFMIGGIWYSKALFGPRWSREAGVPMPEPGQRPAGSKHPAVVFVAAYVFSVIAAFGLAWLIGPTGGWHLGLHHGMLAGVAFVATAFGINYQFGNRSWTMFAIDAGYHVLHLSLMGLILGAW